MRLELHAVSKGAKARVLAPTSVVVESGQAALVQAETEQRPTVLGLIASGRMRPDSGSVLIDGEADASALRHASALVDAPEVSDPDADVLTVGVVAEELMYAGRTSNPIAARKWMTEHGYDDIAFAKIGTVEPSRRIRILAELASQRRGVRLVVIVSPDRHGGRPQAWWRVAEDLADRGLAVLVIAGRASWQVLLGEDHGPDFADGLPTIEVDPLVLSTAPTAAMQSASDTGLPVFDATVHEEQEAGTLHPIPAGGHVVPLRTDPDADTALNTGDIGGAELGATPGEGVASPENPRPGDAASRGAAEADT